MQSDKTAIKKKTKKQSNDMQNVYFHDGLSGVKKRDLNMNWVEGYESLI